MECIILSVNDTYMDAQEVMHMTDYSKITALYSRLSVGDEDRDGGESKPLVRSAQPDTRFAFVRLHRACYPLTERRCSP